MKGLLVLTCEIISKTSNGLCEKMNRFLQVTDSEADNHPVSLVEIPSEKDEEEKISKQLE